ncbi:hypothetical protein [Gordonia sp. (in: high G+C Gram-positive bacteria)]|uniref:phage tail protein n=1 Tax=Gordonia sp. (in: high G+C Gram-positive bacteria) TaxID=84139 RepID=UPI0033420C54
MTEPWASAHVDVDLDFDNIDVELVRRLRRSAEIAERAMSREFDKLAANARRSFDRIGNAYDTQMKRMERRTMTGVAAINRTLGKIEKNTVANVDVRMTGASAADIRATASALSRLQRDAGNLAVRIDISINSIAEVRELSLALQRLPRRQSVDVDVNVDRRGGMKSLRSFGGFLGGIGKSAAGAIGTIGKFAAIAGTAVIGVGALVPVVGALGAALGAVAGAGGAAAVAGLFAVGAAAAALKTAFSGVGDAAKNMFDPEKAEEFEKALAKLAPSAQNTMRAVQGLGKQYAEMVKMPVQSAMFAGLAPKIAELSKFLPSVRDSLVGVAEGFNDGANGALRMINSTAGMSMVKSLLKDSGNMAANFGAGITGAIPGFLALGASATKVFSPMTDAIGGLGHRWSESMLRMQQDGTLEQKIQGLVGMARQFGQVLSEVGSIIGGVFRAASAAGEGNPMANILGSLQQVSAWVNGPGQQALTSFFQSVGQVAATLMPVFLQIAGIIGGTVAPMIAQLITSIGPALQTVVGALGQGFAALQPAIAPLGAAMAAIGTALAPVLPILGQLIAQFVQIAGPVLGSLAQALSPILQSLGTGLVAVFKALEPAIAPVQQVFQALSPVIAQIATILGSVLAEAITALVPVVTTVADVFSQVLTAVSPLLPILGDALTQIIQLIAPIIQQMAEAWAQVVTALLPLLPPLMQIVQALLPPLIQIVGALLPLITVAAQVFAALVPAIAPVVTIVAQVVAFFAKLLGGILSFVATALGAIVGFVTGVITGFANMIATVISTVTGWVSSILGFFGDLASSAMQKASELWSNVSNAFSTGVGKAVEFVQQLPGKIMGALSGAGKWLVDTGKQAIQGLIDGVKSMLSALGNAIVSIFPSIIQGPVRSALGLALGGMVPGLANGGLLGLLGGGEINGASTTIRPGGFIVNAAATRQNKGLLKRLAPRGRVLTGPGTGTSDSINGKHNGKTVARVSKGEFYAPPGEAAAILPLLMAINSGKKARLSALADGGQVGVDNLVNFAKGVEGKPYVWGGTNWGDCSGAVSAVANFATGRDPFASRFATGSEKEELAKRGFKPGLGPQGSLNVGWFNGGPYGGHTAATLPNGVNFEMGGGRGDGQYGGPAAGANDPQFTDHAHLPPEHFGGLDAGSPTGGNTGLSAPMGGSGGGGTPIGSGVGSSSGGSPSWGNSGGGSRINSASEAKRSGITPVWVENWPASIGGGTGGSLSTGSATTGDLSAGSTPTSTPSGPRKDLKKGASKQDMMDAVYRIGKAKGMTDEQILAAGETLLAESDGKNYANSTVAGSTDRPHDAVGSDGKSLGVMQQQSGMGWGDDAQLMDPEYAIGKFYDRMKEQGDKDGPAHTMAQSVQRSAFSDGSNYLAKKDEASTLLAQAKKNQSTVPVTPQGTVPVTVTPGTTPGNLSTGTTPTTPGIGTSPTGTTPGAPGSNRAAFESMRYGIPRANSWAGSQNFAGQAQQIGMDALREFGSELTDPLGLSSLFEKGFDHLAQVLADAEKTGKPVKFADVVNFYGTDPAETKKAATEGMTAATETYRQG